MKKLLSVLLTLTFTATLFSPVSSLAALTATEKQLCTGSNNQVVGTGPDEKCVPKTGKTLTGADSYLTDIINLLLFLAGAIAVIVIIIGGIRYITSTGDAMRIKQAKDTILYGIVGLIIAIFAYAIVNSLVWQLTGT